MTTAPDRVSVIVAQVTRTDRRALSQAWYDALHVALTAKPSAPPRPRRTVDISPPAALRLEPAPVRSWAQTLELAGGRVRLLVRTDERATRIVAVCAEQHRAAVARALAGARVALGAAGIATAA
jgi:hypothetical protein